VSSVVKMSRAPDGLVTGSWKSSIRRDDILESLEETLDIMDSAALLADIRESLAELSTAKTTVLCKEEALRLISGQ